MVGHVLRLSIAWILNLVAAWWQSRLLLSTAQAFDSHRCRCYAYGEDASLWLCGP